MLRKDGWAGYEPIVSEQSASVTTTPVECGSSSTFISPPFFALSKDIDLLRLHILSAAVQAIIALTGPA